MDSVLDLIAVTQAQDENGVWQSTETVRQIFCRADSVTRREFYDAGRNGLNPAFKFTVFAADYGGEPLVGFGGLRYSVYRTYHVPATDYMELYVERKGGTNGQTQSAG